MVSWVHGAHCCQHKAIVVNTSDKGGREGAENNSRKKKTTPPFDKSKSINKFKKDV